MKIPNILAFLVGAAVGGIAVWSYAKEKYAGIAEEEIRSVKETFQKRQAEQAEYDQILQENGYTDYASDAKGKNGADETSSAPSPLVISPDEFEENEEYVKVELLYFADGVLTDEVNEVIENADEIIGDALEHFGEYEDDSVYVQNDVRHCCYAIRKDLQNYADVLKDMPPNH